MKRTHVAASLLFTFGLFAFVPLCAANDFFLHSRTNDFVDNTGPTATTAKFKVSAAVNRTTYREIGTWAAAPASTAMRLNSLSDLHVWIGLKNSDDQGTSFDLRAELRKNGVVVASGETKTIKGVTRNPSKAKEVTVSFGAIADNEFNVGDVLSLRILTKVADRGRHRKQEIREDAEHHGGRAEQQDAHEENRAGAEVDRAAPKHERHRERGARGGRAQEPESPRTDAEDDEREGHSNAVGLRLYYDAVARASRFGATFAPATPPLRVTITFPASGSVINKSPVLVLGEVIAPAGTEVGVTVNGFSGLVANSRFTALVPVDATVTSLTGTATDAAGSTASDTIPVTVQPSTEAPLRLSARPPGGLAPLTVGFRLSSLVGVSQVALDLEGDGTVDFQGTSLEGRTFTYGQAGVYTPTVHVTDPQGQRHSAVMLVQVSDRAALDARLQAVWQGLKDALRAGNVALAATFIHSDTRTRYRSQFSRFSPTTLANIDLYMTTIQLVAVGFAGAEYEMFRVQSGQTLSFAVWFQMDQDGVWKVRRF